MAILRMKAYRALAKIPPRSPPSPGLGKQGLWWRMQECVDVGPDNIYPLPVPMEHVPVTLEDLPLPHPDVDPDMPLEDALAQLVAATQEEMDAPWELPDGWVSGSGDAESGEKSAGPEELRDGAGASSDEDFEDAQSSSGDEGEEERVGIIGGVRNMLGGWFNRG